ncbi:MAG: hypothetical protein ISR58_05140 [Anaerolineales bacterium]|nr:hypothetical protein [Chloroflexota bacterium]MBL6980558.1 hypothetical protein [Anaerolineales bacterium]
MTKTKRNFESETLTISALRLESTMKLAQKPDRKKQKSRSQASLFFTEELIQKIIDQVKAI